MKHNDPAGIGNAMSYGSTPPFSENVKTNIARSNLVPRARDTLGRGTKPELWHNPFVFPTNPGDPYYCACA